MDISFLEFKEQLKQQLDSYDADNFLELHSLVINIKHLMAKINTKEKHWDDVSRKLIREVLELKNSYSIKQWQELILKLKQWINN